ncbi:hypothetical protein RNJ44_04672 [Nakaseomyces bracarensis]|uniref:Uncharacterized protein n=1 Tax=Nakaseomyces bracarensis TaxID=273131 RepID=A0ABR4NW01_9SACH
MFRYSSVRVAQSCRFRIVQRLYSSAPATKKKSKFDKSALKPLGLLVIFGSILTNVMEERRKFNNMERRYTLKIDKLEELVERCKKGDTDIDISNELKIIDAMFSVSENQKVSGLIAKRKREYDSDIKQIDHEKESLESIWEDIMKSVEEIPQKNSEPASDLITDPAVLEKRKAKEELERKSAPSYLTHTIVESPGELSEAAKDTSVKKFL